MRVEMWLREGGDAGNLGSALGGQGPCLCLGLEVNACNERPFHSAILGPEDLDLREREVVTGEQSMMIHPWLGWTVFTG